MRQGKWGIKMKKINLLSNVKKHKKVIYSFSIILWIVFTVFVLNIIFHPTEILEETYENKVVEETLFSYKADMIPYFLNSRGGMTNIEKVTFTKVTKDIILHIKTSIKSDKPVSIKGSKKVILRLVAEDLWEKEYELEGETSLAIEGTDITIIDNDYNINIPELMNFIRIGEEEINLRPTKYTFEIEPIIEGVILYDGKEIPIDQSPQTFLEYSQTQIKVSEENKFSTTTPITKNIVIPQYYNMMIMEIPMKTAKYMFGSFYLMVLLIFMIVTFRHFKRNKLKLSETQIIDKKYKLRLINVLEEVDKLNNEKVVLGLFKSLVIISDEKESPIFRYENEEKVVYYVLDGRYIYLYQINNNREEDLKLQYNSMI